MLRENDIKNMRKLFNRHHYVMTTAELLEAKLYYADIKQLLDEGFIERIRRGYYHWIENCEAKEIVIINSLFPDAVLCMETALFYYEYSDRNPAEWNFAIDRNVSKLRTNIEYPFIKAYRLESDLVTLGETTGEIDFTKVRIYDRDRTICDVLKNMSKMDKEIFNKAIQGYLIALRDCFELNDGDTLQIETNGDVSIINDVGGRFQREVKHHFGNTSISDRDIDFWKTLANWYTIYYRNRFAVRHFVRPPFVKFIAIAVWLCT